MKAPLTRPPIQVESELTIRKIILKVKFTENMSTMSEKLAEISKSIIPLLALYKYPSNIQSRIMNDGF